MDLTHTDDGSPKEQQDGCLESSKQSFCDGPVFNGLSLLKEDVTEVSQDDRSDHLASTESASSEQTVMGMLEALTRNSFCLLQTSQFEHMQKKVLREADQSEDFVRPYAEFEAAYLGNESGSKVWWLNEDPDGGSHSSELKDRTAVEQYMRHMHAIQNSLAFQLGIAFGCEIEPNAGPKFFRRSCASAEEHRSLRRELLHETVSSNGAEVRFLDFIQRRRLCMMYVVDCSSSSFIELHPRDDATSHGDVRLFLAAGQLLIFRHEILAYTYKQSVASNDLVLQSWFLEEPRSLQVNELLGSNDMIASALNACGSAVPHYQEVHVTGLGYKLNGGITGLEELSPAIAMGLDGATSVPQARWDHDLYYHPEGDDGKALCKHGAFLNQDVFSLDTAFFGMTEELAASLYPIDLPALEVAYTAFVMSGFTMKTLRNAPISVRSSSVGLSDMAWKLQKCIGTKFSQFSSTAILISTQFHLKGVAAHLDTACSSSNVATNLAYHDLRQRRDASQYHTRGSGDGVTGGLVYADQFMESPWGHIGMSQAKMVGRNGRARTYEMSADGMQRGEGTGAMFQCLWDSNMQAEQLAQFLGGAINQDGRSASLTAPNGPSQTKVLRQGINDTGRALEDVTTTELHGTGTALGDPIEVGSTRAVMINRGATALPLLHSSGKSNTNHQEYCAGLSGIIRMLMSVTESASPANQHIRVLNSNIDNAGYPALWPTEKVHNNFEYLHNGVTSCGFGGTNARIQLWGRCRFGVNRAVCAEKTEAGTVAYLHSSEMNKSLNFDAVNAFLTTCSQCLGTMCWTCGEATEADAIPEMILSSSEKHQCCMVRSETATYDCCSICYQGEYILNTRKVQQAGDPFRKVYIVGSFLNVPSDSEYAKEMQMVDGTYVHTVSVGQSNSFTFNIVLDQDPSSTLYPVVPNAPQKARVLGPGSNAMSRTWLIEPSSADRLAGGEYEVRFRWDSGGKSVSWQWKQAFTYYIVSSWTNWKPQALMENAEDPTLWESAFQIGEKGSEEFQFLYRDGVSWQDIYPNGHQVTDTTVQILGPDKKGHGKNWLVDGKRGETFRIQLKVDSGHITMSTYDEQMNTKTWRSDIQERTHSFGKQFFIAGSWNGWKLVDEMQPAANHVYVWQVVTGFDEEFQIIVDQNWSRVLHAPEKDQVLRHGDSSRACGPDGAGHGCNWKIVGSAGATVEIRLNLNLEKDNGIPMISCKFLPEMLD